jgi:hypothetical protein
MQWIIDDIFQPALDLNCLLTSVHPNQIGFSFRKEGTQILNRMKAGLTRFENELSSHPPELIKEVKALQNICNGEGIANENFSFFEGANHYLQSDLEGCGKRGQKIVGRLIYPLPFPNAGYYEKPSDKTKPEVVPEQPLETQPPAKKEKRQNSDSIKINGIILKNKTLPDKELALLISKKLGFTVTSEMIRSRKSRLRKKGEL